jgi:hypothetical protein
MLIGNTLASAADQTPVKCWSLLARFYWPNHWSNIRERLLLARHWSNSVQMLVECWSNISEQQQMANVAMLATRLGPVIDHRASTGQTLAPPPPLVSAFFSPSPCPPPHLRRGSSPRGASPRLTPKHWSNISYPMLFNMQLLARSLFKHWPNISEPGPIRGQTLVEQWSNIKEPLLLARSLVNHWSKISEPGPIPGQPLVNHWSITGHKSVNRCLWPDHCSRTGQTLAKHQRTAAVGLITGHALVSHWSNRWAETV